MDELKFAGLRAEMARRGDTQESLAKLLDLPESSISRRLSGEIEWSIGEIDTICKHYETDCYELGFIER